LGQPHFLSVFFKPHFLSFFRLIFHIFLQADFGLQALDREFGKASF